MVNVTDPFGRILDFLPSSSSISVTRLNGPVPEPQLLRKSGSAGNRTRTSGSVAKNSDTRPQGRSPKMYYLSSVTVTFFCQLIT
jgi:hypothetical protein